jgi:hypothetical protein
VRRFDIDLHVPGKLPQAARARLPAQLGQRCPAHRLDEIRFGVVLLQVDEGGKGLLPVRQQIEAVDGLSTVAEENLAGVPGCALVQHGLGAAESIEDLQRALGPADGAGADADLVVLVQHERADALQAQITRRGETHRACADDHHRIVVALAFELRNAPEGIDLTQHRAIVPAVSDALCPRERGQAGKR